MNGELRYTEVRPAAYNAKARLDDMALRRHRDVGRCTRPSCSVSSANPDVGYRDRPVPGVQRLALRPRAARARAGSSARRCSPSRTSSWPRPSSGGAATAPGHRRRVHPSEPDRRLEAVQQLRLRPDLAGGVRHRDAARPAPVPRLATSRRVHRHALQPRPRARTDLPQRDRGAGAGIGIDNIYFSQALSNPFDMMSSMAFLLSGGVCERFPSCA